MIVDALHLLARANLAGGLAIVAVALLRWPVRSLLGASAAYRLWAVPLVVALAALAPTPDAGPVAPIVLRAAAGVAVSPLAGGTPWPAWLVGLWAAGALAVAAMLSVRQARFAAAVRQGRPASVGGVAVVRTPWRDMGPAVVGRAIVVPDDFEARFTPAEQAAVLAHESRHLARGDVAANGVVALVQCLCWFNPLVHLAARWMRVDQELACDADVIAGRPGLRRSYAEALIKTLAPAAIPPVGCAWRDRGFHALRDRIRLLKRGAPGRARRACGALLLAGLTLGGGYAAWATQPSQATTIEQPDWESLPSGADLARFYPPQALAQRLDGMALMRCRVEPAGDLAACEILREGPPGVGFGQAALQMASLFRMRPLSMDGKPVSGGVVRIPIRFRVPPTPAVQP